MFNTNDKHLYVDIPNRMFDKRARAYVSSNLICGTTVHQEERGVTEKTQKSKLLLSFFVL